MFTLDEFIADLPKLHTWDEGKTYNTGGFGPIELATFRDRISATSVAGRPSSVMETGAGASTIAFLLMGCAPVISIAPDAALWQRIDAYLKSKDIASDALVQVNDYSEFALPRITEAMRAEKKQIDFALIDGDHHYPAVFIDYCYMNSVLRLDGHLVVDDVQEWPPKELARFVAGAAEYELAINLGKTVIFRKTQDFPPLGRMGSNAYIQARSKECIASEDRFAL